jgi:hypothetical protein
MVNDSEATGTLEKGKKEVADTDVATKDDTQRGERLDDKAEKRVDRTVDAPSG